LSDFKVLEQRLEALEAAVKALCELLDAGGGKPTRNGKSRPHTYEEVEEYVVGTLKLTRNDAAALWEHWESTGFKCNGRAMASWKATASNWERRKLFYPSLSLKFR
jgi:hypothetical protein